MTAKFFNIRLSASLFILLTAISAFAQAQKADVQPLPVGGAAVKRQIKTGDKHFYSFNLKAGDLLWVELQEEKFDARIALFKMPEAKPVEQIDREGGEQREALNFTAVEGGEYLLLVGGTTESQNGGYALLGQIKAGADGADKQRIAATDLFYEGRKLAATDLTGAAAKLEAASGLWKSAGEMYWAARNGLVLARIYDAQNEKRKAIQILAAVLPLLKQTQNRADTALALTTKAAIHSELREFEAANADIKEAAEIFRISGDEKNKNEMLSKLVVNMSAVAKSYEAKREYEKAIEIYKEILPLARESGNQKFETNILEEIGGIYYGLKNHPKAIEFYSIELANRRKHADKKGEARMLSVIGSNYGNNKEYLKAIEFYQQAVVAYRQANNPDEAAELLFLIGSTYQNLNEREKAIAVFSEALPLFQAQGNRRLEESTLRFLGILFQQTGEYAQAAANFEQILTLQRANSDKPKELKTLRTISIMNRLAGEFEKAVEISSQAVTLARELRDTPAEAENLLNIGRSYRGLKQFDKALEFAVQAETIYKKSDDQTGQGKVLLFSGIVAAESGAVAKSLEIYNRAIPFFAAAKDKKLKAAVFEEIAVSHTRIFGFTAAIESQTQALAIYRELKNEDKQAKILYELGLLYTVKNQRAQAIESYNAALEIYTRQKNQKRAAEILEAIGTFYADLNEKARALEFYERALKISREIKDADLEVKTLNSIGVSYYNAGDTERAFEYFNQALPLLEKIKDQKNIGAALNNVAAVYEEGGETTDALNFYSKALTIRRANGDNSGEATTLNNMGTMFIKKGLIDAGLPYLKQALPLFRAENDKKNEAVALANLRAAHEKLGNKNLSIAYGKLAVARYQEVRQGDNSLDNALQKTYLQSIEPVYRNLTAMLLDAGRLSEAQQVLNAFKDQQAFDFSQSAREKIQPLELTKRETAFVKEYETESTKLNALRGQSESFRRSIGGRETTAAEKSELETLDKTFDAAEEKFAKSLTVENELARLKIETEKLETADTLETQRALRELAAATGENAAAIYTLAGAEEFQLLVITSNAAETVSHKIKREDLNLKATEFWTALNSPANDPRPLGRELYDIVFKNVQAKLPAGTTTLMWSLDGALRYIPMAALFDGEKYLIEKYRNAVFTRSDRERLLRPVSANWTATGFGSSEAHTVNNSGEKISFNALPAVRDELRAIFKADPNIIASNGATDAGIFSGQAFADKNFTKTQMLSALKAKRPVVHIASHFAFRPGDDARSFLLLGDGAAFTLAEMKSEKNLFDGVQLLTLSACNTAAVRSDADGREIDGFAELAQRLGADSVIASLWSVADESTQLLMSEFYRIHGQNPKMTKAEAMQTAQKLMIEGKLKSSGKSAGCRSEIINLNGTASTAYKCDANAPFAHPFYWSSFVLFGNWR